MIDRLKKRLTATLAFGVSLILVLISFFVVFTFYRQSKSAIYTGMDQVYESLNDEKVNEIIPDTISDVGEGTLDLSGSDIDFGTNTAIFIAKFKPEFAGTLNYTFVLNDLSRSENDIDQFKQDAFTVDETGRSQGVINFTFYSKKDYSKGTLVLFNSDEQFLGRVRTLISTTAAILIVGILFSFWVARMLASWLTRPVQETLENQTSFISDVSHELKTPLAVITANADAIEADYGESKWLTSIKTESIRMAGLITELLAASKLEHADTVTTFESVDFSSIVNEAVMTFDALAYEKGVLIDSDIADNIIVLGSAEKLRRLVGILLDNAVKYVNEGGSIVVKLQQRIGSPILTVKNTGSYVEKEYRKKIFDRFFRVDESRTKDGTFGSYGLGLSIARTIVEEHNGDIVCQSFRSASGDSTLFKVTL